MKAAVLYGYNQPLKIEEVPKPQAAGTSVLVKVVGSGVCHSDVHLWKGELETLVPPTFPLIMGHEVSGVVEEVGELVPPDIEPGMEVLVYWAYCERDDKYAQRGLYQLCGLRAGAGIALYNGGFSEYMLVPHYRYIVPVRGLQDLEAAAILADAGVTAYRAVRKTVEDVEDEDYVLIVGLGGVGIFGLQLLRLLAGARIVGVDVRRDKVESAAKIVKLHRGDVLINASEVSDVRRAVMEATGGQTFKAVIDFVGTEKTIETYIDLLSPLGVYTIVGLGSEYGPRIPIHKMVLNELNIKTVLYGSIRDLANVADMASRGLINYWDVTAKIKLEEVNVALERLARGEAPYRQVIVFR
ncbi:MAG: alcohol dehydrogenase catalytic domain-containing protein [Thermoprotei archaeon]|nr:alcohol dehydrogenase catalytic domain-containing protein [Thermoprotei archaeon]